jgi:hypothetical protein
MHVAFPSKRSLDGTPYASNLVYIAGGELQQETYGNGGATFNPDLNLIGFIPELGIVTNTINAGIDAGRGNYGQASLYGAAAVASVIPPGAGAIAKGGEALVEAAEAAKVIEGAKAETSFFEGTYYSEKVIKQMKL